MRVLDQDEIDSLLGFHPEMAGFARMFNDGHLSVVHGVGYPNPNGDHAVSMRYWQTARPHDNSCQTGWLGRALDNLSPDDAARVPAVYVGQIKRPFTLNAETAIVPTVPSLGKAEFSSKTNTSRSRADAKNPLLDFIARSTSAANETARRIDRAARDPSTPEYPSFPFAQSLRTVAQLIRAEVGIRIYYTEIGGVEPGGFDNHANQLGNHCALLRQLSESMTAFVDDLKRDKRLDRVLVMTFSEFGRTVKENGRRGTGHASAAPMFLAGGRIKGGQIGQHPNLTDLQNGGQKFHTDFRRLYATALGPWLGFDPKPVLGEAFQPIDVLRT